MKKPASRTKRTPIADLSKPLAALVKLLQRKGGTALYISQRLACSKPTAYARLTALRAQHGYKFTEESVRDGSKGPLAVFYSLSR
jgi:hypothetical protein